MANFIGKIVVSSTIPKTFKQLLLEAIDLRMSGKTADEKNRYLTEFSKWISDETVLFPQGADIYIIDNYLAVPANVSGSVGTNVSVADMNNFGTLISNGTSKHIQKGVPLQKVLIISSTDNFGLDVDVMIGEY